MRYVREGSTGSIRSIMTTVSILMVVIITVRRKEKKKKKTWQKGSEVSMVSDCVCGEESVKRIQRM